MIDRILAHSGRKAVGVIDFNGVGEVTTAIVINGVTYLEADAAVAASGIWTNGASAADGAVSLVAAINGDAREGKPAATAVISDAGDSVVLVADKVGPAWNYVVTTDSASNVTVESMHSGELPGRLEVFIGQQLVTAQDILADEVTIGLPFTPNAVPEVTCRTTAGLVKAATYVVSVAATPARLLINFAGATDPVATDVLTVLAIRQTPDAIA